MSKAQTLNIALVGSGGDGVMVTANMILKTAERLGLYGMMTQSYGPQIRGGESAAHVALGVAPINVVGVEKEIVVCFRFSDIARFVKEMKASKSTFVLHGKEEEELPEILKAAGKVLPIPFQEILEKEGLPEIAKNILVFGMLLKTLGWEMKEGETCIQETFGRKSANIISTNLRALEVGYHYLNSLTLPFDIPKSLKKVKRLTLSGNEACAKAAVDAGCRFYAGYPITPSSEILGTIHKLLPKVGGHLLQAEDEIAAMGMVIGASYGGVPAMTATSGPGLSLMTEMIGLSSMAEIPVVIVDCQRAGPSTGMPSRTEQSDLWHALYGGHGDFPRVVLAPMDVKDCFKTIHRAFYLAEGYQLPVIVLSDASIGQRLEIIDPVDGANFPKPKRLNPSQNGETAYRRYDLSSVKNHDGDGVTPMAIPGMPQFMHAIAGIEHTETGTPSSDGDQHEWMNQKRFLKLKSIAKETADWYTCFGPKKATHALITWGSPVSVAKEYLATHSDTALFVPEILHPFPLEALKRFLKNREKVTVLEMNFQGQLFHYLTAMKVFDGKAKKIHRSGGLPFQTEEIETMIQGGRQ